MARERPRKACCLVSEILEEAGLDREKVRTLRRQVLQGVILFCQWQLDRMARDSAGAARPRATRRAQQVEVE